MKNIDEINIFDYQHFYLTEETEPKKEEDSSEDE
jgi:hypothetical protein